MTNTPSQILSGTLVRVAQQGVLILGDSGLGKSEIALNLIDQNHILIADDMVEISLKENTLIGSCPSLLQGFIECREIGILRVEDFYGKEVLAASTSINIVLHLIKPKDPKLGSWENTFPIEKTWSCLGRDIPAYSFEAHRGRNYPLLIKTLVRYHTLKQKGIDPNQHFIEKHQRLLRELSL